MSFEKYSGFSRITKFSAYLLTGLSLFWKVYPDHLHKKAVRFLRNFVSRNVHFVKTILFTNTRSFIKKARLEMSKNQAKAKQHLEVELLLFESFSLPSSTLSSKHNKWYSKNVKRIKSKSSKTNKRYLKNVQKASTSL